MLRKELLLVILLFSFVCGAENGISFPQQAKPLILAKNDKSLSKRRKKKTYKRKKRAKSSALRKRRIVRKNLLLSVSEYSQLPRPARRRYIRKIRRAYLQFELRAGYDELQTFPERNKQALFLPFSLLISYSEAVDFSKRCLIGGVLRPRTASDKCPVYGRKCNLEGETKSSSNNFRCGVAFNNVCVSIKPVKDLSERCNKSADKILNTEGYEKHKDDFDNIILPYCENQTEKTEACNFLKDKLEKIKGEITNTKNPPQKLLFRRGASQPSATEIPEQETAVIEDTNLEATNYLSGCDNSRIKDQVSGIGLITEAGRAIAEEVSEASNLEFLSVCERTEQVKEEIMRALGKNNCKNITQENLLEIDTLDLSDKNIKVLKLGDFSGLKNLKNLSINQNKLENLSEDIFNDNPNLTILEAIGNSINRLPPGIFQHNLKLSGVSFHGNSLKDLDKDIFRYNPNLESVNFKGNFFLEGNNLPIDIFQYNLNLRSIYLPYNISDKTGKRIKKVFERNLDPAKEVSISKNPVFRETKITIR